MKTTETERAQFAHYAASILLLAHHLESIDTMLLVAHTPQHEVDAIDLAHAILTRLSTEVLALKNYVEKTGSYYLHEPVPTLVRRMYRL